MLISPRVDQIIEQHPTRRLKLGIMGGTFDPIHFGHLICAEQAREQFGLDFVVFMPTGNPAFKMGRNVSSAEDRYNMAVIATRKNVHFDVSRIEVERKGVTYTYDTLVELRQKTPEGTQLYFITGADAIISVLKWKNADEILQMAHFIAATRPGYDYTDVRETIQKDPEMSRGVSFFEVPGLAISSTDLRRRIMEGKSITYMTPVSVANYIKSHKLYQDIDSVETRKVETGEKAHGTDGKAE